MTCDTCQREIVVGDWPFCPHGQGHATVIGDEMDHWQTNGTKTPIHFRSKGARKAWLKAKGLEEMVRHVPLQGSDKSPHTSDWGAMTDPYTAANVKELLERAFQQKPSKPADDRVHFRPFGETELTALDKKFNPTVS